MVEGLVGFGCSFELVFVIWVFVNVGMIMMCGLVVCLFYFVFRGMLVNI